MRVFDGRNKTLVVVRINVYGQGQGAFTPPIAPTFELPYLTAGQRARDLFRGRGRDFRKRAYVIAFHRGHRDAVADDRCRDTGQAERG